MRGEAGEIVLGAQLGLGVVALRAPPDVTERAGIRSRLLFAIKITAERNGMLLQARSCDFD